MEKIITFFMQSVCNHLVNNFPWDISLTIYSYCNTLFLAKEVLPIDGVTALQKPKLRKRFSMQRKMEK